MSYLQLWKDVGWDEGKVFSKRYLRYMRIEQHGKDKKDDSNNYMPLYRAMKSGQRMSFPVLYYATLKEDDIKRV